ncbi:MAG TPA: hypothetical protein VIK75_08910 [Calditerricola sp.]
MHYEYSITGAVRADEITPGTLVRLRRIFSGYNAARWVRVGLILADDRGRIIPIRWDGRPVDVDVTGHPVAWDPGTLFETAELLDRVQEQRLRGLARKWAVRRYRQHLSQK